MKKAQVIMVFAIIFLVLLIAVSILYFSKPKGTGEQITCNSPYITLDKECCLDENLNSICDNKEEIILEVEKGNYSAKVYASARTFLDIYTSDNEADVWKIYKNKNEAWTEINSGNPSCITSCESICESGSISCVASVVLPTCKKVEKEFFSWNGYGFEIINKTCPENSSFPGLSGKIVQCALYNHYGQGDYKIRFNYKEQCFNKTIYKEWNNQNIKYIEKEFVI